MPRLPLADSSVVVAAVADSTPVPLEEALAGRVVVVLFRHCL